MSPLKTSSSAIVDFSSSMPCDHRHELFWNTGGVSAVRKAIMECPCNPGGKNPFCIHFAYQAGDQVNVTDYLRSLGCSEILIRCFHTTQFIAAILDTTRRVVVKGNVNPGDRSDLHESRGILDHLYCETTQLVSPGSMRQKTQRLIGATKQRLSFDAPKDGAYFLQHFWDPVRIENTRRQLLVRQQVGKKLR